MIRNPLEMCKSHFNYAYTHSHLKRVSPLMYKLKSFQKFCKIRIQGWAARIKALARASKKRRLFLHYEAMKMNGSNGLEEQLRQLKDFLR